MSSGSVAWRRFARSASTRHFGRCPAAARQLVASSWPTVSGLPPAFGMPVGAYRRDGLSLYSPPVVCSTNETRTNSGGGCYGWLQRCRGCRRCPSRRRGRYRRRTGPAPRPAPPNCRSWSRRAARSRYRHRRRCGWCRLCPACQGAVGEYTIGAGGLCAQWRLAFPLPLGKSWRIPSARGAVDPQPGHHLNLRQSRRPDLAPGWGLLLTRHVVHGPLHILQCQSSNHTWLRSQR
jgi:hypothetical protein